MESAHTFTANWDGPHTINNKRTTLIESTKLHYATLTCK